MNVRAALCLAALLAAPLAEAQVPARLGYQGRLLNANGSPATGIVSITFNVYAAASGGAVLWSESQQVPMSSGYYAVVLGSVTPLPASLFDGTERFLELSIGGTALTPRQAVDSVAYAIVAQNVNGGTVNASSVAIGGTAVITDAGQLTGPALNGIQSRVTGTCTSSQFIQQINANGTVTCGVAVAPDGGSGLTSVAHDGTLNGDGALNPLSVNTATSVQARVTGTCSGSTYVQGIGATGTVACGAVNALSTVAHDGTLNGQGTLAMPLSVPAGAYVTQVTASLPLSATAGATPALSISQATAATDGYLAKADFATFSGKAGATGATGYIQNAPAAAQAASFQITGTGAVGGSLAVGSTTLGAHALDVTGVAAASAFKIPFTYATTSNDTTMFACGAAAVAIPGLSAISLANVPANTWLEVSASGVVSNSAGGTANIQLFLDGAAVNDSSAVALPLLGGCTVPAAAGTCQASIEGAVQIVTAGAHTVDLKFLCGGAGNGTFVGSLKTRIWAQ